MGFEGLGKFKKNPLSASMSITLYDHYKMANIPLTCKKNHLYISASATSRARASTLIYVPSSGV